MNAFAILPSAGLAVFLSVPAQPVQANPDMRTLVVRERNAATLLDGTFTFRVLKLRGYSIDVRLPDGKRVMKMGQSFAPDGADCSVIFKKISPETRIARFLTDCP